MIETNNVTALAGSGRHGMFPIKRRDEAILRASTGGQTGCGVKQ